MKAEIRPDLKSSDIILEEVNPQTVKNRLYYLIGLVFLVLNKVRHELQGYSSARGFSTNLIEKAVSYDLEVVSRWSDYLKEYKSVDFSYENKSILELGPGADLGVGLFLLAEKATDYYSIDVHNLIKTAPKALYDHLFQYLESIGKEDSVIREVKKQFELVKSNQSERLNFLHSKDFDLTVFPDNKFDLVVSNSAFTFFDDPEKTIAQLDKIVKSGALFIGLFDLKTLTRWIKTKDPLNIYRYNKWLYRTLRFKGAPNRMRPYEYKNALEFNGWTDVKIFPRIVLNKDYVGRVDHTLNHKFKGEVNQMQYLTVVICATKK